MQSLASQSGSRVGASPAAHHLTPPFLAYEMGRSQGPPQQRCWEAGEAAAGNLKHTAWSPGGCHR